MITCQFEDGNKIYLRHVVVENIVINDKNQILLVKRAKDTLQGGKFAFPGGYMERDERISESLLRELKEETGYTGEIISLFTIIDSPDRKAVGTIKGQMIDESQNIALAFIVKAKEKIGDFDHEIEEITWFDLDKLPPEEQFAFDHYETLQLYLSYLKNPKNLPIFNY